LVAGLVTLIRISGLRNWWGLSAAGLVLRNAGNALVTYGLSAFVSRLDILILKIAIAPTQLGLYGSAMTLATIPEIAATYLAPAFLPRIDAYCREGIFVGFFFRFHLLLYSVMGIGYGAVLWLLPRYGGLILPAKYEPAIAVTLVLLPGTLATASIFPLSLNLLMLRSSRVFIYFDLLVTPVLAVAYSLASRHGILTVAALTAAARILKTLTVQFFATRAAELAQAKHLVEQ
jgi:O-antigen/teichoic acid export membrane protein